MELNHSGKSVLVVDNQLDDLSTLRSMLSRIGFSRIQVASSSNMALNLLKAERYDLCFVNYDLGRDRKNGLQLLQEAADAGCRPYTTAFVLVVEQKLSTLLFGSLEHSPDTYISKPYDLADIRHRLGKLMRIKAVTAVLDKQREAGRDEEALLTCRQLIDAYPGLLVYLQRLMGIMLIRLERYEEAMALFRELIRKRKLAWAEVGLGWVQYRLWRLDEAFETLNGVLERQQICAEAFLWLGRVHWARGELADAVTLMRKAVLLQPTVPALQAQLADYSVLVGDWKQAAAGYRAAVEFSRNSSQVRTGYYFALGGVLIRQLDKVPFSDIEAELMRVLEEVLLAHPGERWVQCRTRLQMAMLYRGRDRIRWERAVRDAWLVWQQLSPVQQQVSLELLLEVAAGSAVEARLRAAEMETEPASDLSGAIASYQHWLRVQHEEHWSQAWQALKELVGYCRDFDNLRIQQVQVALEWLADERFDADRRKLLAESTRLLGQIRTGALSEQQLQRYRGVWQRCADQQRVCQS